MDLKEQEYVIALAKYGSISRAAEALFITQPTLSIFLNRLEKRLGIQLFEKAGRRLVPTMAGELYIKRAKELLMIQSQFQAELSDLIAGCHGRLRLGIHARRSSHLLPKVMAQFQSQYPNIDLILDETNSMIMEKRLLEGDLDLILSNRFFQTDKLAFSPVYQDTLLAVLPPSHPACEKAVSRPGHTRPWLDLKEIKDELLILQYPHQATRVFTDRALAQSKIKPRRMLYIQKSSRRR